MSSANRVESLNVHVNRTLQALRGENLVEWDKGVLTVLDWEGLKLAGEFDPDYLHQDRKHVAKAAASHVLPRSRL